MECKFFEINFHFCINEPSTLGWFNFNAMLICFLIGKITRHVDLKGNLLKAMMVMNWLNMLEVEDF